MVRDGLGSTLNGIANPSGVAHFVNRATPEVQFAAFKEYPYPVSLVVMQSSCGSPISRLRKNLDLAVSLWEEKEALRGGPADLARTAPGIGGRLSRPG